MTCLEIRWKLDGVEAIWVDARWVEARWVEARLRCILGGDWGRGYWLGKVEARLNGGHACLNL